MKILDDWQSDELDNYGEIYPEMHLLLFEHLGLKRWSFYMGPDFDYNCLVMNMIAEP